MTHMAMSCIERTCPGCGAANRVVTSDIRPSWEIRCSSCGTVLVARPGLRPQPVHTVRPAGSDGDGDGLPGSP